MFWRVCPCPESDEPLYSTVLWQANEAGWFVLVQLSSDYMTSMEPL